MNVVLDRVKGPGLPPLLGPHLLAWTALLDEVFADAYHHELETLHFAVPDAVLEEPISLRADLTPTREDATGVGSVIVGSSGTHPTSATRRYRVRFGMRGFIFGWATQPGMTRLTAFTLRAAAWSAPIRLARLLGDPHLQDHFHYAMRAGFTDDRHGRAFYSLTVSS